MFWKSFYEDDIQPGIQVAPGPWSFTSELRVRDQRYRELAYKSVAKRDLRGGFKGGCRWRAPPLFFAEIGHLTLCGRPRQTVCTKSCKLTLKITIFFHFWGGTSPSDTPLSPQGSPSFKKSWIRPLIYRYKKYAHNVIILEMSASTSTAI